MPNHERFDFNESGQYRVRVQSPDLVGEKFHHLTVLAKTRIGTGVGWICQCSCGKRRTVTTQMLNSKNAKSCGCMAFKIGVHPNRKYSQSNSDCRAKAASIKACSSFRGIPFQLTLNEAADLVKQNCHYCGSPPSVLFRQTKVNGIDRVNSKLGYTNTNVVPCCKTCNFAKSDLTKQQFDDWIKRLITHRQNEIGGD